MPIVTYQLELTENEAIYLWATVKMDEVLCLPNAPEELETVRDKLKRLLEGK